MDWVAELLSGLSLAAVVVIGLVTIKLGQRSATAAEQSTQASLDAARATERSAAASVQAAEATQRAVAASERAARLAEQDARMRRLEALLDVVLEMRDRFNDYYAATGSTMTGTGSPERMERIALGRKMEARLVPFEDEFPDANTPGVATESDIRQLRINVDWSNTRLENAIFEITKLLKSTAEGWRS